MIPSAPNGRATNCIDDDAISTAPPLSLSAPRSKSPLEWTPCNNQDFNRLLFPFFFFFFTRGYWITRGSTDSDVTGSLGTLRSGFSGAACLRRMTWTSVLVGFKKALLFGGSGGGRQVKKPGVHARHEEAAVSGGIEDLDLSSGA